MKNTTNNLKLRNGLKAFVFNLFAMAIMFTSGCSTITKPQNIIETMAYADRDGLWSEFRAKNPYNYQAVGIKQYEDNSYNILISEPSDNVSEKDLRLFFKKYNCDLKTFKCQMGYDGWLKDAVVSFNNIKSKNLPKMTNKLFELLYDTDYKAFMIDLDTIPEHIAFSSQDLNYQISEDELRTWFIDQKEALVNVEDSSIVTTIAEALIDSKVSDRESQLYYSKETGFVVWVIKRSSQLDPTDFMKKARMFALDSDLVLGAISNNQRTAIIARERSIPVYELPPMRQEMLALLARTHKDELSQSIDLFNLFAGKLPGGKDFAPIWLSDELWHTEFGNTLNLADLVLKSWSENGKFTSNELGFYPQPFDWAFNNGAFYDINNQHFNLKSVEEAINNGIPQELNLSPILVYNWNTRGAGYTIEGEDGLSIYSVNRTGALPITFSANLVSGETKQDTIFQEAEEIAYDYFSSLSNPELVKVVQYTTMYQIFNRYSIHIPQTIKQYPNAISTYDLDICAEAVLDSLCVSKTTKDNAKLKQMVEDRVKTEMNNDVYNKIYHYNDIKQLLRKRIDALFDEAYKNVRHSYSNNIYNTIKRDTINNRIKKYEDFIIDSTTKVFLRNLDSIISYIYDDKDFTVNGQPFLRVVGHHLLNHRQINIQTINNNKYLSDISDDQYCQYCALLINQHSTTLRAYNSLLEIVSNKDSKEIYLKENKDKSSLWQKSPTIVEMWRNDQDSVLLEGGHELSSRTIPIRINNELSPGLYKVIIDQPTGQKTIEICAKDQGRITSSILRKVERPEILGIQHFDKTGRIVRPRSEVMANVAKRTERGFNQFDHGRIYIAKDGKGFVINGKRTVSSDGLIEEFAKCVEEGESAPFQNLVLENISENEQIAIIDGLKTRLDRSRAFSSIPNRSFDISKVEFTDLGDGSTFAKIPINAQDVRITTASWGEPYAKTNTLWSRVKSAWFEFKIPTEKLEQFKALIQEFFKNPAGTWNRFQFQRKLKLDGFDPIEIKETYEFSASIAMLYIHQNTEYYVLIEKNIA